MEFESVITKLNENSDKESEEVVRLLLKICSNIIKEPNNLKIRVLQKSNQTISKKILQLTGGSECLRLMGFVEEPTEFKLPLYSSFDNLKKMQNHLMRWQSGEFKMETMLPGPSQVQPRVQPPVQTFEKLIKPVKLPPLQHRYTNSFLRRVEQIFHGVLAYEDKDLQARAKTLIPLTTLEENVQKRLRNIQKQTKNGMVVESEEVSVEDLLLLELLEWFKGFFIWVDSPSCQFCGGKTEISHMSTDPKMLIYTDRVELHKCVSCQNLTPFARYNDLNILLETRSGRCGEWANTFTLFCRSLGWDARYVVDEGDHVWTEVFSIVQNRWLHCDPCENVCDTPLMYETGWNKKISYIMAYSADDIQDVTWRYSCQHKDVMKRRKNCSENELIKAIMQLRNERQQNLTQIRREYLVKRLLKELVELMVERNPSEGELQGRTSGSAAWRLARGETDVAESESAQFSWILTEDEIKNGLVRFQYSAALDTYYLISSKNEKLVVKEKWHSGILSQKNVFRKEEKDWNNVYLARKEGTDLGSITWRFEIGSSTKKIKDVKLEFDYATYENGEVSVKICSENTCLLLPKEKNLSTADFAGAKSLEITANLSGGQGNVAWQHTQLFRQSSSSEEYPFKIQITFA